MMDFAEFLGKDITLHTDSKTYRGVMKECLKGVIMLEMVIDKFYIDIVKIVAITVHGAEQN